MLRIGGVFLAGLPFRSYAQASGIVEIVMKGNADGSKVWFDPIGVLVRPGETVRWINRDPGNAHTSTAYHPDNEGRPLRIPEGAEPWNSDYLLPDQSFEAVLDQAGVYDYFCIPHEHAGMVGRLVVAEEGATVTAPAAGSPIPEFSADPFPSIDDIVRLGRVTAPDAG
jgi:plastocyanin